MKSYILELKRNKKKLGGSTAECYNSDNSPEDEPTNKHDGQVALGNNDNPKHQSKYTESIAPVEDNHILHDAGIQNSEYPEIQPDLFFQSLGLQSSAVYHRENQKEMAGNQEENAQIAGKTQELAANSTKMAGNITNTLDDFASAEQQNYTNKLTELGDHFHDTNDKVDAHNNEEESLEFFHSLGLQTLQEASRRNKAVEENVLVENLFNSAAANMDMSFVEALGKKVTYLN